MATWLLLKSGFPSRLPREIARCDAPDIDTAIKRLGLLSGLGAANLARSAKEAMQHLKDHWVQSEASALLGPDAPKKSRKPSPWQARRRNTN